MMYESQRLRNVTVLGAAGKMGSGISLLAAIEMADLSLQPENKDKTYVLNAIDVSHQALNNLMQFLKPQIQKIAEKKIVLLRQIYRHRNDLIENQDIINQYVFHVLNIVRPATAIEPAYQSSLIFEAIIENPQTKVNIFTQIDRNNQNNPWFFTNTSSIPINKLDQKAQLNGRIIGFHFYNPPAVQKLVELIQTPHTQPEIVAFAFQLAKNLKKKVVPSNDYAGFIGNGHFMRDALHGISQAQKLVENVSFATFVDSIYIINKITQDLLIRPMGIFQLIDYVGIDVCRYIMNVMKTNLNDETLHSGLLDRYHEMEIRGGQNPDGTQKDGIFQYLGGKPYAIYDPAQRNYIKIEDIQARCHEYLAPFPSSHVTWKNIIGNPNKEQLLETYFTQLKVLNTPGSQLAVNYGRRSKEIAIKLVSDNVARTPGDVNTVMLTGFFHAYGPINTYFD